MNTYAFYVRKAGDRFRYVCLAFFQSDGEAAALAVRLLPRCGGVDVWRDGVRVGLFLPETSCAPPVSTARHAS